MNHVLSPAYNRDYATADEVIEAYFSGVDFRLHRPSGIAYCSCRDFIDEGDTIELRYHGLDKLVTLTCKEVINL